MKLFVAALASVAVGLFGGVPAAPPAPPAASSAVPVLVYHGIDAGSTPSGDPDAVALTDFTAQMAELHAEGYQTIGPDQYRSWVAGSRLGLPRKPILITFDDNQATAPAAVPVLRRYGFRATMYVVSGFADGGYGAFYLPWQGIDQLVSAGWYIQFHAGPCGHAYLTAASPYNCAAGLVISGSAKTGHRYYPLRDGQTEADYHSRVENDVTSGLASIRSHLGYPSAWTSVTFAVPWDDWGQATTSNEPWLAAWFASTFPVVFVQESYPGEPLASSRHLRYRFQVGHDTGLAQLTAVLGDPRFSSPTG